MAMTIRLKPTITYVVEHVDFLKVMEWQLFVNDKLQQTKFIEHEEENNGDLRGYWHDLTITTTPEEELAVVSFWVEKGAVKENIPPVKAGDIWNANYLVAVQGEGMASDFNERGYGDTLQEAEIEARSYMDNWKTVFIVREVRSIAKVLKGEIEHEEEDPWSEPSQSSEDQST